MIISDRSYILISAIKHFYPEYIFYIFIIIELYYLYTHCMISIHHPFYYAILKYQRCAFYSYYLFYFAHINSELLIRYVNITVLIRTVNAFVLGRGGEIVLNRGRMYHSVTIDDIKINFFVFYYRCVRPS